MNKPANMANVPPNWQIYFRVPDVDAAAERIKAAGGKILNGPMDVPDGDRIVNAMDPQGAAFGLHHKKKEYPARGYRRLATSRCRLPSAFSSPRAALALRSCGPSGPPDRHTATATRLLHRRADRAADVALADQRRQPLQPALLAAQGDQPRQRRAAQGRVAHAAARLGHAAAVLRLRAADRRRRRRLREHRRQRRVRAVDRHRRDPLAVRRRTSIPNITSVCCGWNNKGVAISEDKVFSGQLDGQLVALDRATGKVAWSIQAERWQENFSITAARPLYFDGMVIIGFAGGDRGTRSRVKAYDAKDGRLSGPSTRSPVLASRATTRGRRTTTRGSTAAPRSGRRRRIDPELGLALLLHRQRRRPTTTAPSAPATTSTPRRWWPSRPRPASTAGTSSRCITTSGTTTRSIPSS